MRRMRSGRTDTTLGSAWIWRSRASVSTRSRLRESLIRCSPVASLRRWLALAARVPARPERDSARVIPAAAALRSVASRAPSRYWTTIRWNDGWSPSCAARLAGRIGSLGVLAAFAPVAPTAAITARARVQGRMLRFFMNCPLWERVGPSHMGGATGSDAPQSPSAAVAHRMPVGDGCAVAPRGNPVFRGGGRGARRRSGSPAEASAQAHRLLVAAEGTADGHRGALADRALVAHRQGALPALEADAHAEAVLGADARGAGGHVAHRRAHRALAVDAAVLVGEAPLQFGL